MGERERERWGGGKLQNEGDKKIYGEWRDGGNGKGMRVKFNESGERGYQWDEIQIQGCGLGVGA